MQRRSTPQTATALASLAGLALIMSACSDTTAPSSLRAGSPALTLGPTAHAAPVQVTLASGATTQYCGGTTYTYTIPATVPTAPCAPLGFDLQGALAVYNPGWSQNLAGSAWIGPNSTSNQYKTSPGRYVFQTQFTIPAGATGAVLNDTILSDNAVAVFLNGNPLEAQVIQDCPSANNCNWQTSKAFVISDNTHLIIGGTNTLTVVLVDTPNGGNPGNGYACTFDPQQFGMAGFSGPANVPTNPNFQKAGWTRTMAGGSGCENPTGLDFHGNVAWNPPVVTTWCSPGFWKNNGRDLWTVYHTKLYSSLVGAAPLGKKAPTSGPGSNPTLLEVIDNPNIYGGEATNSVADFISNKAFGTPIGSGVESCPGPDIPALKL